MKQKIELLRTVLNEAEISADQDQLQQLIDYAQLIAEWNRKIHLISKNDVDFVLERHILPSFFYVKVLREWAHGQGLKVLDLGSGAGLPGVVISILQPAWTVWLLDSNRKKTLFLRHVQKELKLHCAVVCERFETFIVENQQNFDWIVARAVAPLGQLIYLLAESLEQGTKLLTMKGMNFQEELKGRELKDYSVSAWPLQDLLKIEKDYLKNKCLVQVEKIYG